MANLYQQNNTSRGWGDPGVLFKTWIKRSVRGPSPHPSTCRANNSSSFSPSGPSRVFGFDCLPCDPVVQLRLFFQTAVKIAKKAMDASKLSLSSRSGSVLPQPLRKGAKGGPVVATHLLNGYERSRAKEQVWGGGKRENACMRPANNAKTSSRNPP